MKTSRHSLVTRLFTLCSALFLLHCGSPTPGAEAGADAATEASTGTETGTGAEAGTSVMGCAGYCSTVMTNCTAANAQYTDMAECMSYCATAGWPEGTPGAMDGNSIQCRIYHGGAPAMMMPTLHCPHAGPSGSGVCGSVNFRNEAPAMYTRVDRMGMPAVATALIGSARKNAYNDADPAGDMAFAGDFIATLTSLHTALDDDLTALGLTPCSMTTMVGGLPECVGQSYAMGATVASLILPNDVLNINTAVAAGFPNGRRLQDPVIDVTLGVLLLKLDMGRCGMGMCSAATLAGIPLNPGRNDVAFLDTFPYLAAAHRPR